MCDEEIHHRRSEGIIGKGQERWQRGSAGLANGSWGGGTVGSLIVPVKLQERFEMNPIDKAGLK